MKKLSRSQKNQLIERVKTVILVLLFLSCLYFGYLIFETYKEQAMIESPVINTENLQNAYNDDSTTDSLALFKKLSQPKMILINGIQSRSFLPGNDADFNEVADEINTNIFEGYKLGEENITKVGRGEWETALKANSVYVKYPATRYIRYESDFYGIENRVLEGYIKGYTEALVVPEKEMTATVFLRDSEQNTIAKIKFEKAEIKKVAEVINKYESDSKRNYAFACELNLDDEHGSGTILDSMICIPTTEIKKPNIRVDVPKRYKIGLDYTKTTEFTTDLANIFAYNPNTVRQYINSDDALVFVGETGNMSIYPDGRIEYKALGTKDGILLGSKGRTDVSGITEGIFNILKKVMIASGIDFEECNFDINFSNILHKADEDGKTELYFDYFVDGCRVSIKDEPSVITVVEDGVLTEFKMQVRNIERLETSTVVDNIFEDIDKYCAENPGERQITDSSLVYRFTDNGEMHVQWEIKGEK